METMSKINNKSCKKKGIGRQKIEIKKIEKESARQVAFTKRRQGVMKKASELAILCGVEFAFIAFSPGGNPFSFGHPSFDSVVERFLTHNRLPAAGAEQTAVRQLNMQYIEMEQQLEAARGRRAAAEGRLAAVAIKEEMGRALEKDEMEAMNLEELEVARKAIEEVKSRVQRRQEEMVAGAAAQWLRPVVDTRPFNGVGPVVSLKFLP